MAESLVPTDIRIRGRSRVLELQYSDGHTAQLPFELLRVCSPSAEVQGHGPGPGILQTGKQDVTVTGAEIAGNYALQISFSDGHDTGLFTWKYLRDLSDHQQDYWQRYLERLEAEGGQR